MVCAQVNCKNLPLASRPWVPNGRNLVLEHLVSACLVLYCLRALIELRFCRVDLSWEEMQSERDEQRHIEAPAPPISVSFAREETIRGPTGRSTNLTALIRLTSA